MGKPAAKQGDAVVGVDTHVVMIPSPAGPIPTPMIMPFSGKLASSLSEDVQVEDKPAALKGSGAVNSPPHVPAGGPFQKPPSNQGKVTIGSDTVFINDKHAARSSDSVETCSDPADAPNCVIQCASTVLIG